VGEGRTRPDPLVTITVRDHRQELRMRGEAQAQAPEPTFVNERSRSPWEFREVLASGTWGLATNPRFPPAHGSANVDSQPAGRGQGKGKEKEKEI
jgi:hypothetical protein